MEILNETGMETMEMTDETRQRELLERMEHLQALLEEARNAGDIDVANYYESKVERLQTQLESFGGKMEESGGGRSEISFGSSREGFSCGHSESYWKEKAGEELAENGKTSSYDLYLKRAGEAAAAGLE